MKIELNIEKGTENLHRLEIIVENGISKFQGFDYIDSDDLESFELYLIGITKQIYDYRKQRGLL